MSAKQRSKQVRKCRWQEEIDDGRRRSKDKINRTIADHKEEMLKNHDGR